MSAIREAVMRRRGRGGDDLDLAPTLPATCRRVQTHLPRVVSGEASRLRRRLVDRHLVGGCEACVAEHARQVEVDTRLRDLVPVVEAAVADEEPPEWLLGSLLAQAEDPGLRARAAAPMRGAVSGARPELTVAAVVLSLAVAGGIAWAGWRLGRAVAAHLDD